MTTLNKTNRIWFISDTHLGTRNNSLTWLHEMRDYFTNFFIPLVKEHYQEGDILVHGGDLFHNRQSMDMYVMHVTQKIFADLLEIFHDGIYIIVGNHDIKRKLTNDVTSLDLFAHTPGVHIYKDPHILDIADSKILLLPWKNTKEEFTEEITEISKSTKLDYLVCHTNITGFSLDNGRRIDHGVSMQSLKEFKRVYSGHIHKRQERENMIYLGNPYHITRSDRDNVKGIYMLDVRTGEHTFYANNYSPQHLKLRLDSILDYRVEQLLEMCKNNYVDLYVPSEYMIKYDVNDLVLEINGVCKTLEVMAYDPLQDTLNDNNMQYDESVDIIGLCTDFIDGMAYSDDILKSVKNVITDAYTNVNTNI